jgi:GLPGLI family protein
MKFYGNKTSEVNDEDYSTILLMADMQGTCYRKNKSELLSVEVEKYGNEKDFIITKKLFTEWEITEEKKMVCGYECFKATTLLGVDYGDKNIISLYPLTAWYCPELIYSYGPKGLGGLPGMILELEQNLVVFRAVKVSKKKQDVEIALPMNKSIISESKMYDLLEDSIEESLNNCNSKK